MVDVVAAGLFLVVVVAWLTVIGCYGMGDSRINYLVLHVVLKGIKRDIDEP